MTSNVDFIKFVSWNINGVSTKDSCAKLYNPLCVDPNGVSLNNSGRHYCERHGVDVLLLQETKMHDDSKITSTKLAIDPLNEKPFVYFDNNNTYKKSKGGTSIIILHPDKVTTPTLVYADSNDDDHWVNPNEVDASTGRVQIVSVNFDNDVVYIMNIYAPSKRDKAVKTSFFEFIKDLLNRDNLKHIKENKLIVGGDWNLVENLTRDSFRVGQNNDDEGTREAMAFDSSAAYLDSLNSLTSFIDDASLTDPSLDDSDLDVDDSFGSFTFAHKNKQYWARLDRFYVSPSISDLVNYNDAPPILVSDHFPIMLTLYRGDTERQSVQFGSDVYKISTDVIGRPHVKSQINRLIISHFLRARVTSAPRSHNNPTPRPYALRFQELIKRVGIIYTIETKNMRSKYRDEEKHLMLALSPNSDLSREEKRIAQMKYDDLIEAKLASNKASHHAFKHSLDEKGTREFFRKVSYNNKAKSAISELVKDSSLPNDLLHRPDNVLTWKDNPDEIKNKTNDYWSDILRCRIPDGDPVSSQAETITLNKLEQFIADNNLLPDQQSLDNLKGYVNEEEIRESINTPGSLGKAPGKDGVPIEFYVTHTNPDDASIDSKALIRFLYHVYAEAYDNEDLTPSQHENIVALLFKKNTKRDRRLPKNYRPITLQNIDYKILYRALAQRLVKLIDKLVPYFQHAFVPGRCISNAILLFKAILNNYRHSNASGAIFSIDFEKAYDSVDHKFTIKVLRAFKIPEEYIRWVKMAFKSSSMQILVNGYLTDAFPMLGGGKQGDPLYPYLFLLVMTAMAAPITLDPCIEGVKLPGVIKTVKTIQFADDSPFFI